MGGDEAGEAVAEELLGAGADVAAAGRFLREVRGGFGWNHWYSLGVSVLCHPLQWSHAAGVWWWVWVMVGRSAANAWSRVV
ncbi:hypothetical protein ADK57_26020 [Streptomyces sp. MMG1533]|nr:hypothetical protein ADK57_26020 [Streptomyces sp. MMG1533]